MRLLEAAHWCIAGQERRNLIDYGYWYEADGRSIEQQRLFESVEVKPQALEWMFSVAAGVRFRVSADNLNGKTGDLSHFKDAIYSQVQKYLDGALTGRAQAFVRALAEGSYVDEGNPMAPSIKRNPFDHQAYCRQDLD